MTKMMIIIIIIIRVMMMASSPSLSLKCALRESGCRIGCGPTKNELRSLSAVDVQGHQRGGFCIVPFNCALREFGCRICY